MKKMLVLISVVCFVVQLQAAKVIISQQNNTPSVNVNSVSAVHEIPAKYIDMQATFLMSAELKRDDQNLKCYINNPSGLTLVSQFANDPGDASSSKAYESVSITYTGILQAGSYTFLANSGNTKMDAEICIKSIICIVWDAPGQEVVDLKAELNADIATTRSELEGEINTKTADLQSQINTKAQELADLAAKHDAEQTLLLGKIVENTTALTALEQKHNQEVATLTQTITDNKMALETALTQLETKHDQEVATINQNITTLEGKLDSEILAVYNEINILKATLDAFMLETRSNHDSLILQVESLNVAINERLRRLNNRVNLAVYATTKLNELKTQGEANILAKQAEIVAIDIEIKALEEAGQDASSKITLRNIKLDEYATLQADLEDIVAAISIRENDSEFKALRNEIAVLNSINAEMDARITAIEGLVIALQQSITDGDNELHAKIDTQITALRAEILDKMDKDLFENNKQFDSLRQMISNLSNASPTMAPTGAFSAPAVEDATVPTDNRDMRVSPYQSI